MPCLVSAVLGSNLAALCFKARTLMTKLHPQLRYSLMFFCCQVQLLQRLLPRLLNHALEKQEDDVSPTGPQMGGGVGIVLHETRLCCSYTFCDGVYPPIELLFSVVRNISVLMV